MTATLLDFLMILSLGVLAGSGAGLLIGFLAGKPIFCLPGGPPSNEMAFLQLTLPGLLKMKGEPVPPIIEVETRLDFIDTAPESKTWVFNAVKQSASVPIPTPWI